MNIAPISPKIQFFKGNLPQKDDTKIYIRKNSKNEAPDFSCCADAPVKIWSKPVSKLQEGQIFNYQGNNVFNRHTTFFFRPDLDWNCLGDYLKEKFSNANKVNTYVWGCSYGDEAYSINMLLMNRFKDDYKKFYPIIAKDIDKKLIDEKQKNKNGATFDMYDYECIKTVLNLSNNEMIKYVEKGPKILKNIVTAPIEFSYGNIVTDIDSMDGKNPSIVFCRNMWPYINPKKYDECAKKMYDTLKHGSVIVIGSFDCKGDERYPKSDTFPNALINAGFKEVNNINKSIYGFKDGCLVYEK